MNCFSRVALPEVISGHDMENLYLNILAIKPFEILRDRVSFFFLLSCAREFPFSNKKETTFLAFDVQSLVLNLSLSFAFLKKFYVLSGL